MANGAVRVQARTMFHQLGEMLGDEMPTAPGRMLQEVASEANDEVASFGTENIGTQNVRREPYVEANDQEHVLEVPGEEDDSNLMQCLMQEFQEVDIEGALHCIMENISAMFGLIQRALVSVLPALRR